jgi:hypothetical protein
MPDMDIAEHYKFDGIAPSRDSGIWSDADVAVAIARAMHALSPKLMSLPSRLEEEEVEEEREAKRPRVLPAAWYARAQAGDRQTRPLPCAVRGQIVLRSGGLSVMHVTDGGDAEARCGAHAALVIGRRGDFLVLRTISR